MDFSVELFFKSLKNHFVEKEDAVNDVKLFLDTHPENQKALDYFQKYKEKRIEALKEYAEVYGPLTVDTVSENSDCWNWINEPWPWQEGGC